MRLRRALGIGAVLMAGVVTIPGAARAQAATARTPVDAQEEARLLREAAALERSGRADEAVATLEGLLGRDPASASGLLALERVLRSAGRVEAVLPHADRFIEVEPDAAPAHGMKLRVLAEIDSVSGLRPAADAWFAAEPGSPGPYREVARIFSRALGDDAAIGILEEGRRAVGGDALALELGDLLAATGREQDAVEAWARALDDAGADEEAIVGRLARLAADDRERLARPLLEALQQPPSTVERRVAAVRLALGVAPDDAEEIAEEGAEELGGGDRPAYLDAVAHHAAEAGAHEIAYWALQRLRGATRGLPATALDERLAAAALAAGDTAAALEARQRVADEQPAGSPERRAALADIIRIEARTADADALGERLEDFRREFPGSPEADALAAAAAAGLAARGQGDAALQLADHAEGPRTRLERAWLLFEEGRIAEGREALEASLPVLAPTPATEVVQLLAQLDRVGPATGSALALATAHAQRGRPGDALEALEDALDGAPSPDRAPLHARSAQLALAVQDTSRAERHLRSVVDEHEASAEAPEALLTLARIRAAAPEGVDEARALLERLILERPQAAVVPAARRELQRLGRSG